MKKHYTLLFSIFFVLLTTVAQQPVYRWAKSFGGSGNEEGRRVVVDDNGDIYIAGRFDARVDFDPGPGVYNLFPIGGQNLFLSKLDKNGNFLWAKQFFMSYSFNRITGLQLDKHGEVLLSGNFRDSIDFDSSSVVGKIKNGGNLNGFLAKFEADGTFIWAKNTGEGLGSENWSMTVDPFNNVLILGVFIDTVDFDPGSGVFQLYSPLSNNSEIFLQKLDSNGNFVWVKSWGGTAGDRVYDGTADHLGNVYATGWFGPSTDFDPGPAVLNLPALSKNTFISKFDAGGNFLWAKGTLGVRSRASSEGRFISIDSQQNILICGLYKDTVDFDPSPNNTDFLINNNFNFARVFVWKLDALGNYVWVKEIDSHAEFMLGGFTTDQQGNSYLSGTYRDSADFDPDTSNLFINSNGFQDFFIWKLDPSGQLAWVKSIGGNSTDISNSLFVDPENEVYTTGVYNSTVDFDAPNGANLSTHNASFNDVFILKLGQCFNSQDSIFELACSSYTSPSGQVWSSSGNYMDTIFNAQGCDSVIAIKLALGAVDTSILRNGIVLQATSSGKNYQWLDCNNGFASIPGATAQSYTAATNGSYALEITDGVCIDTSACQLVLTVGIDGEENEFNFQVQPNPTTGNISLSFASTQKQITLRLRNALGQLLEEKKFFSTQQIIYEIKANSGIYWLELTDISGKVETVKLVKE